MAQPPNQGQGIESDPLAPRLDPSLAEVDQSGVIESGFIKLQVQSILAAQMQLDMLVRFSVGRLFHELQKAHPIQHAVLIALNLKGIFRRNRNIGLTP